MFKLDDSVIARIAQVLQESIMTGSDIVDHMRLMRLETGADGQTLLLTSEYKEVIENYHRKLLDRAEELKNVQKSNN